ncbi:hypothetical protein [Niallia sp. BSM11]|uniref:hypothetical protein n=1 Tax=Niallia sp. BSM11 TaxID=3391576 RepID=UPI0039855A0C
MALNQEKRVLVNGVDISTNILNILKMLKKGGVEVKRYSAALSIVFTFIGISPLFIYDIGEWFLQILIVSMAISLIFALCAEKNIWRKIALWFLGLVFLVLVLFFLAMTILWDEP